MIKKVMLITPPNTMPSDSIRRIGEPLGLLYIGTVLEKNGFSVEIFDMTCEGYYNCVEKDGYVTYGSSDEELIEKLHLFQPEIVGVSCLFSAREKNTIHVINTIKRNFPNIIVVVGGIAPSLYPEKFLGDGLADYVIIGEGEFRFLKLLHCLNDNSKPTFDGVAFIEKGSVVKIDAVHVIEDLDSIPIPNRNLVNMEQYFKIGVPYAPFSLKDRVAQIFATRGCPFSCVFCSTAHFWGHTFRKRTINNILKEITQLITDFGVEEIQFIDDNLTIDKKFAKELFSNLKELNIKWCTPHGLYLNSLDEEMIKIMADSGAYQLTFAIESASDRVLKEIINKNVNLKNVENLISCAHQNNISVHGLFVVGFPGETKEEIMDTLNFPFKVGFDSVAFFIANPLPGSKLYDICHKKGYLINEDAANDFKRCNIHIPETSQDYVMSPEALMSLVETKTEEFNEWSKKQNPDRWEKKFKRFLANKPEESEKIIGRVV